MIGEERRIGGDWYEATNNTYNGGFGVHRDRADAIANNLRARGIKCRIIKSVDPDDRRRVGYVVFVLYAQTGMV
ncbi:MAG: hypothetical protein WC346_13095 [Methanogenium sp.]|jgi:hypothetical protein